MPANKNRSAGFGVVGVFIIVFAVLLIGSVGWRIYDANQKPQSKVDAPSSNEAKDESPTTVPETDVNAGYVVIQQWGVRFKPTESLGEVQYFKPKDVSYDALTFTTKALADASASCSPSSGNIIQGLLYRNKEQQPASGEVLAKIDSYYYQYRGPDSTCGAGNDQLELDSLQQLRLSLRSLEEAQ